MSDFIRVPPEPPSQYYSVVKDRAKADAIARTDTDCRSSTNYHPSDHFGTDRGPSGRIVRGGCSGRDKPVDKSFKCHVRRNIPWGVPVVHAEASPHLDDAFGRAVLENCPYLLGCRKRGNFTSCSVRSRCVGINRSDGCIVQPMALV